MQPPVETNNYSKDYFKNLDEEVIKMYGKIDNDSFVENETSAGADLAVLPEYEASFHGMIDEMFSQLAAGSGAKPFVISHESYEASVKALYEEIQKTNIHTTSRTDTNGATTEDLVAGQQTLHTLEQAAAALCDGMSSAGTRPNLDSNLSPTEANGERDDGGRTGTSMESGPVL
jgi:hypothetical protein